MADKCMLKIEPGIATLGARVTGVLADKVFDPGFLEATLGAHASA